MEKENSSWRELQTVGTAIDVIEALAETEGAGVTQLAARLDVSSSSIHSQLATLEQAGYLVRDGQQYQLSHRFLLLGEYVRNSNPLFQFGRRRADDLAEETEHYAHLFVEEDGLGVNIYEARGELASDYDYQSLKLQQREPLHITATGKAILAEFSEKKVRAIVEQHGLERRTENTITDIEDLFAELENVSQQGFATNDEEEIGGFRAVAAPVCVDGGAVLGSVSVSAPVAYFDDKEFNNSIPTKVIRAANTIEVDYNMSL